MRPAILIPALAVAALAVAAPARSEDSQEPSALHRAVFEREVLYVNNGVDNFDPSSSFMVRGGFSW